MRLAALYYSVYTLFARSTPQPIVVTACGTDVATGGTNLAAALAAGGVISFNCRSGSTTIAITRPYVVHGSITIDGGGTITLDAGGKLVMFNVPAGTELALHAITVRGGYDRFVHILDPNRPPPFMGGVARGAGSISLAGVHTRASKNAYDVASFTATSGSTFEDNTGWFVARANAATIADATFADNEGAPLQSRTLTGGRVPTGSIDRSDSHGNHVPIAWSGTLGITKSSFTNNGSATTEGGALRVFGGSATIAGSTFTNNRAKTGGAIFSTATALDISRTNFEGNQSQDAGGAIAAYAGASDNTTVLRYAKLRRNQSKDGGAVYVDGRLSAGPALFTENTASGSGGALHSHHGQVELIRVIFTSNRAGGSGGAMSAGSAPKDQIRGGNVLLAGNSAPSGGGFIGSNLALVNATVVGNEGAGIVVHGLDPAFHDLPLGLSLRNTILKANAGGNCSGPQSMLKDDGHNVQFPGTACGSSVRTIDPMIDGMYVPSVGSPVRFAGDEAACTGNPLVNGQDVYGSERPAGQICAVGAVEQDLEHHALRLLAMSDALPQRVRAFLRFVGVARPQ